MGRGTERRQGWGKMETWFRNGSQRKRPDIPANMHRFCLARGTHERVVARSNRKETVEIPAYSQAIHRLPAKGYARLRVFEKSC